GGLALRVQPLPAHEALAAADLERHDHPVARGEAAHLGTDLFHDAHRLVSHDVAGRHERRQRLVEMQVRTADRGRRHPDDGVGRLGDARIRHVVHTDVAFALPGHCLHGAPVPARPTPKPARPAAYQPTPRTLRASRIIWWVKPHSLSYHAMTLTNVSSTTWVMSRSTMAACGSPTMSEDTSGSSETAMMPRYRSVSASSRK